MSAGTGRPEPKPGSSALLLRLLSAAVMIPPALAAVYFGSPWFDAMVFVGAAVLAWEWFGLCGRRAGWLVFGAVYLVASVWALIYLRTDPDLGAYTVFWLFAMVWAVDTGAYAAGRTIGGPKLAPRISPNKTWAGLGGGVLFAALVGGVTALVLERQSVIPLALASGALGVVSQGGDLLESWVKRRFDKKDSGIFIPGHGGLFDRVDGLLAAALAAALITEASGKGSLLAWV